MANAQVNDWSFQIHAICKSITFQYIKGCENVLVDSLSRLGYYELYEPLKPKKPGHEFNKPITHCEEVILRQPPGSTYEDANELNLFSILLDQQAPATEELSNLQGCLKAKLPVEKLQEAQYTEYANILKAVRKHKDRLAHLYVQNGDGLLYRII